MDISNNFELLDKLASAYALGTLRGGARRRFETQAREDALIRAAALTWQSRVAGMTELQVPSAPASVVWTRIHNLVQADSESAAMRTARSNTNVQAPQRAGWLHSLLLWRSGAAVGAIAAVVAITTAVGLSGQLGEQGEQIGQLQARLAAQPQIEYVAVLNDDQASASVLVTFDPKSQRLTLQRVGGYQEAADKSLQLWALPPAGGPRSLGVLTPDKLLQLTASANAVREVPTLAISLEPKGGVPSERGPTGPVLFKGALIQKML